MNEGIVIVGGKMGGGPWGFDVRHNGQKVGHEGSHSAALTFARGFAAGIFAANGTVVAVEDRTIRPNVTGNDDGARVR